MNLNTAIYTVPINLLLISRQRAQASLCVLMAAALFLTLLFAQAISSALSLQINFYRNSCPRAETIVRDVVQKHFIQDPSIGAGLLRLHFHDCFNTGCDASVLLDSTDDNIAQKEAPPNLTLRGFEVIDEIKEAVENECRGVVSCADIVALATRDGVALSGGPVYAIPLGRRDSLVSNMFSVHLPGPTFPFSAILASFQNIHLDVVDLVTLLGAHSIGICHCVFFLDRLYNFRGSMSSDPRIDPSLLVALKQKCPPELVLATNVSQDHIVFINQATASPFTLDGSFYRGILSNKAVLQSDQDMASIDVAKNLAIQYANNNSLFMDQFAKSMIKLGGVGVLTRTRGEIRLNCRKANDGT